MPSKAKIQEMFDSIAPEYDAFNHIASMGIDRSWRKRALKFVRGPQVLDMACGTGDFSLAIARHLDSRHAKSTDLPSGGQWKVTGADISGGMLAKMKTKVAAAGFDPTVFDQSGTPLNGITSEIGDCTHLSYADESFDTVTVAFGVRNFENREKALQEVLRVLKPGGRFVMLELSIPDGVLVREIFKLYFTHITPKIGGRMSHNKAAYRYLPASVLEFPHKLEWMATLKNAGFRNIIHRGLSFGICRLYVADK